MAAATHRGRGIADRRGRDPWIVRAQPLAMPTRAPRRGRPRRSSCSISSGVPARSETGEGARRRISWRPGPRRSHQHARGVGADVDTGAKHSLLTILACGGMAAIEVRGLHKRYGEREAVRGIDFRSPGEVFGLLGPMAPARRRRSRSSRATAPHRRRRVRARLRPRSAPAECASASASSCRARASTRTSPRASRSSTWPASTRAARRRRGDRARRPRRLSRAARRQALGRAAAAAGLRARLIGDPELVFLDEPTTGFDPAARRDAWDTIR